MSAFGSGSLPVLFTIFFHRHGLRCFLRCWLLYLRCCWCFRRSCNRCGGCRCLACRLCCHWLLGWCFSWCRCRLLNSCRCFGCYLWLWCCIADNLIIELVDAVVLDLTVHHIFDDVAMRIRNKVAVLIAHTCHHHCRLLAAVLITDSQLQSVVVISGKSRYLSVVGLLWCCLGCWLRWCWFLYDAMTLTIICHCLLVCDTLQL